MKLMTTSSASLCLALLCLLAGPAVPGLPDAHLLAQSGLATQPAAPSPPAKVAAPATAAEPLTAPKELDGLKYRSIGPAAGGRVSRAVGVPGDPRTYYAATASGGVWKSVNGGLSWSPIFDDQPVSSIGSIAVALSDPNVVYVGSGEANIRGNVAAGNGIYKSLDAGKTWVHVWKQEGQIGTIAVHPRNPDVVFAAVLGHAFGPNPERGVYRTSDGGRTWKQVLTKNAETGASDVALDPSNPNIVFAGLWQAKRLPWDLVSGGPGSGLHVSRDGGDTWKAVTGSGLPDGIWGKVGVAVAPSDSRRVYALIEAEKGGLFRSDDGGATWKLASGHRALRQRAWYYSTMTVHPTNADEIWFPQVPMLRTIDGGTTITERRGFRHGDHHDLWIDPLNPKRMIDANDGGVEITVDGGETWLAPNLPISQFYHVSADNRVPYHVAGAMQDLGTAQGPSNSLRSNGIVLTDWRDVGGGEAGHVVSKTNDPNIVFAGEYLGYISRYDDRTGEARNVSAWPENGSGHGGEDLRYRFQWTAPIALSPHDPEVVYHAAQVLFRSRDGGQTWATISPDLTTNDKAKQKWAGGPITGDNTGVETYCTIFAVAESPRQQDLIWAGSDDGLVHVTRDGGKNWTNVTSRMSGLPAFGTVSLIEPSPHDAGTAYVVVDAHRLDDMRPYLFKTSDFGQTWTRLDRALPQDVYLHAVREDPARRGLLYLGTERGVMVSFDDGGRWAPLRLNMPTVAVHDLVVKDGDLVVGTHGRSLWILDDLTPVREMSDQVRAARAHLFAPPPAVAWQYRGGRRDRAAGANPAPGAGLTYFLKEDAKELTLEVKDSKGRLVRTLKSVPEPWNGVDDFPPAEPAKAALETKAGLHRVAWDLRWKGADLIQGAKIDWGDPATGPMAVPGRYTARLIGDGIDLSVPIEVRADERVPVAAADLEAQLEFALAVRDDISRLTALANDLRAVRAQLAERGKVLAFVPAAKDLVASIQGVTKKLEDLEGRVHNPAAEVTYDILAMRGGARLYSRLSPLASFVVDGRGAPTQGMRDVHAAQRRELEGYEAELSRLMTGEVQAINDAAARLALAFVVAPSR